MRAIQCQEPGRLILTDRPQLSPGPGEASVRIRRAGVCGTDFHIYDGSHPYLHYPRVIGHELSGEIAERGPGALWLAGQQVYVIPYLAYGACIACRRGKSNCCQNIIVLGVHVDGGVTEYLCVPASNVAAADGVTLDEAAMVEFLAIGAHAARRASPAEGDRALVVGAGPIGIGCALFTRLRGAGVAILDLRPDRLDFCRANIGVEHVVVAGRHAAQELSALTDGDAFDVVFDATGSAKSMMTGLNYVAHGGTYVLVSVVREAISFEDPEFHKRETTLLASRNAVSQDFLEVFQAIRAGLTPTKAMLTHRAKLEESPDLFPRWIAPESGVIKAMIEI